jgi:hypothetical protein
MELASLAGSGNSLVGDFLHAGPQTRSFTAGPIPMKSRSGLALTASNITESTPGETTKTITISVIGDSKKEANETFYLDLFGNSPGAPGFTKSRGIGMILDDD